MARFAVLTSGGDAPGMNAAIYGVLDQAVADSLEIVGIPDGFEGLAAGASITLGHRISPSVTAQAGTILRTSRRADLRDDRVLASCVERLSGIGVDGLVVIGGSGSLQGVRRLRSWSTVPIAFVPATIDNDIRGNEETIGFDSAVNYGVVAVDSLRVTAESLPHRAFLVEVLGGDRGYIAQAIAAATPVDVLIVPDRPFTLEQLAARMRQALEERYAIALMSEGCGEAGRIARAISDLLGERVRPTVLGHSQRAADPTARDRRLGLACGRLAVSALRVGSSLDLVIRRGAPSTRAV